MEEQDTQQAVQPESQPEPEVQSDDTTRQVSGDGEPSVVESLKEAIAEQSDPSATSSSETQRGGEDTEKKPRIERRVDSLIEKLKQSNQQPTDPSQLFGDEPIFTQEEIESGQFDPNALSQRLKQREDKVSQVAAQQAVQYIQYQSSVNEHLADIDNVQKELGNDLVLDKLVAKQYDALNHQVNPITGQRVFVPTVKMSEIYKDLKDALDKKSTAKAAEVQNKVAQQAADQAVPVSVSQAPSTDLEGQAAFEKAASTGQVEDWAEVLKKRIK